MLDIRYVYTQCDESQKNQNSKKYDIEIYVYTEGNME